MQVCGYGCQTVDFVDQLLQLLCTTNQLFSLLKREPRQGCRVAVVFLVVYRRRVRVRRRDFVRVLRTVDRLFLTALLVADAFRLRDAVVVVVVVDVLFFRLGMER